MATIYIKTKSGDKMVLLEIEVREVFADAETLKGLPEVFSG